MAGADWLLTVRVRLREMCDHNEKDAADVVRWVLDEENGFCGLADWPQDFEVLAIEPASDSGDEAHE